MKILLLALTVFSSSYAFAQSSEVLPAKLEAEIQKDLEGKDSCFKGKVKELKTSMEENYGGRFGGSYELNSSTVFETQYRSLAKYCDSYLDADLKEVESDNPKAIYRHCENTDTNKSIATISFGASTSGTHEIEGLAFIVNYNRTNDLVVDINADYHPEESEIKSWDVIEELTCTLINL